MRTLRDFFGLKPFLLGPNIPPGASRAFIQLVKAIGEAGSNHEEDRVIRKEANLLMVSFMLLLETADYVFLQLVLIQTSTALFVVVCISAVRTKCLGLFD